VFKSSWQENGIIEAKINGIPALIDGRQSYPRTFRIRVKKRGIKHLKFSNLDARQKQALKNLLEKGPPFTAEKKREAGEAAGYSARSNGVIRAMDRLLERKEIVTKIENACQKKFKKDVDSKVAEVLVDQLEAEHPLSKEKKKDNFAIIKASQELNKLKDNYPAKKIDIREMGFHVHWTGDDVRAAEEYKELIGEESGSS